MFRLSADGRYSSNVLTERARMCVWNWTLNHICTLYVYASKYYTLYIAKTDGYHLFVIPLTLCITSSRIHHLMAQPLLHPHNLCYSPQRVFWSKCIFLLHFGVDQFERRSIYEFYLLTQMNHFYILYLFWCVVNRIDK